MIQKKIVELKKIVNDLNKKYPQKEFTLDGRLVGDLGEILAEEMYKLKLYDKVVKGYDGETEDSRKVQIKTTFKGSISYPRDTHPELLLVLELDEEGNPTTIYNGNTEPFIEYIKTRKRNQSYNYYTVTSGIIKKLNEEVDKNSQIEKR